MGPLVDTLGVIASGLCQIRPQCVHRGSLWYRQPNVARGIDLTSGQLGFEVPQMRNDAHGESKTKKSTGQPKGLKPGKK